MSNQLDREFEVAFSNLLQEEGHWQLEDYMEVGVYDEVPLYSRLSQLSFLENLGVAEQNRLIIRAAVHHLAKIVEYARSRHLKHGDAHIRMVSITGWWDYDEHGWSFNDGTTRMLIPNFWIGNMGSSEMRTFVTDSPTSPCSEFVWNALDRDASLQLSEGWSSRQRDRFLRRVYVRIL